MIVHKQQRFNIKTNAVETDWPLITSRTYTINGSIQQHIFNTKHFYKVYRSYAVCSLYCCFEYHILSYSFGSIFCHCIYGCIFCMLLFNFVIRRIFYFFWDDFVVLGVYILSDFVYFIDWNIITLNGRSIIMNFLLNWISLLFVGVVFIISSLAILYSDDYMFGDLNNIWFVILVLLCQRMSI
jgi:hypothetical protein